MLHQKASMVNIAISSSACMLSASVSLYDCSGQQVPQSRLTSGCKSSFCYWYFWRGVALPNMYLFSISYCKVGSTPLINVLVLFVTALNSTCAFCRTSLCLTQAEWASLFCNMLRRLAPSAWPGHVLVTHCSSSLSAFYRGRKNPTTEISLKWTYPRVSRSHGDALRSCEALLSPLLKCNLYNYFSPWSHLHFIWEL